MSELIPFLAFCGAFALVAVWTERRARARLERWLGEHGAVTWRIWSAWNPRRPASPRATKFERYARRSIRFRIEVRDADGRVYAGWARCLGALRPRGTDDVEVAWDEGHVADPATATRRAEADRGSRVTS